MADSIVTGASGINDITSGSGKASFIDINFDSPNRSKTITFSTIQLFIGKIYINGNGQILQRPYTSSTTSGSSGDFNGGGNMGIEMFVPPISLRYTAAKTTIVDNHDTFSVTAFDLSETSLTFTIDKYQYSFGFSSGSIRETLGGRCWGFLLYR